MGRDIGSAPIERQFAPAATKSRYPAIPVLESEQPLGSQKSGSPGAGIFGSQAIESQQSACSVVGVGDSAGQIRPGPASRGRAGVGMNCTVLLPEDPFADALTVVRREAGAESVHR